MREQIIKISPSSPHLYGATSAQSDMSSVVSNTESIQGQPFFVHLDLSAQESVSGSYIRSTLVWLLKCGEYSALGKKAALDGGTWAIRPLPVFPIVSANNPEIIGDIHDLLYHRELACILAPDIKSLPLSEGVLLGQLSDFLAETLLLVGSLGKTNAQELKADHDIGISAGGWSNRLSTLYSLRLIRRVRNGKFWNYQPITTTLKPWG